jgi:hypothetical protein
MKFAKWIKPGTNEIRVYINGLCVDGRPYITSLNGEGADDCWTVKCFGLYPSQLDELMNRVESALSELNGGVAPVKFGEVLNLIK